MRWQLDVVSLHHQISFVTLGRFWHQGTNLHIYIFIIYNAQAICDRTRQIESLVGEFHYELRAITTVQ